MAKNRRPNKDDGCCSVHFLKYIMFIFNFIFYLTGLTILCVGVWTYFWKSDYAALLSTQTYTIITYIFLGAGALVLLVGLIGCIGLLRENRCCLLLFTFLLLIVFLVEAVAGVMAYIYSEMIRTEINNHLNHTFATKFYVDPDVSKATEILHKTHKCCGAQNFQNWRTSEWFRARNSEEAREGRDEKKQVLLVPDFCCISPEPNCGYRDHPSNIYYQGCGEALIEEIQRHAIIIGAIALGLCTVQIFGMIISCCLWVNLKDFEHMKHHRIPPDPFY